MDSHINRNGVQDGFNISQVHVGRQVFIHPDNARELSNYKASIFEAERH